MGIRVAIFGVFLAFLVFFFQFSSKNVEFFCIFVLLKDPDEFETHIK